MDHIQHFFRGLVPRHNNRNRRNNNNQPATTNTNNETVVPPNANNASDPNEDVNMSDDGMPELQEVSDSSDDEAYNDSDDDEPPATRIPSVGIDTPPLRGQRRVRELDEVDEERDRRHPSMRTAQPNTNPMNSNNRPQTIPLPPPPQPIQMPGVNRGPGRFPGLGPGAHWTPLPGGGIALHLDVPPMLNNPNPPPANPTNANAPNPTPGPGPGAPPPFGFTITEVMSHLSTALGMPELGNLANLGFGINLANLGLGQQQEDPERAKKLVDALEVVPLGLVKRLERLELEGGSAAGEAGGDANCAICWERLLGEGWTNPTETENGEDGEESDKRIVSLPCAHTFHASCLIPWFSRPRQTTCPSCRFNVDPEGLTRTRIRRPQETTTTQGNQPAQATGPTQENQPAQENLTTETTEATPENDPQPTPPTPANDIPPPPNPPTNDATPNPPTNDAPAPTPANDAQPQQTPHTIPPMPPTPASTLATILRTMMAQMEERIREQEEAAATGNPPPPQPQPQAQPVPPTPTPGMPQFLTASWTIGPGPFPGVGPMPLPPLRRGGFMGFGEPMRQPPLPQNQNGNDQGIGPGDSFLSIGFDVFVDAGPLPHPGPLPQQQPDTGAEGEGPDIDGDTVLLDFTMQDIDEPPPLEPLPNPSSPPNEQAPPRFPPFPFMSHQHQPREKKKWTLPPPPGQTLRQRIEKREREAGLRCFDPSCGVGPSDEEPNIVISTEGRKQVHIEKDHGKGGCEHTFHAPCLVSATRVNNALKGLEEHSEEGEVEVTCPVCRAEGVVGKGVWDEGVRANE